jgi:hypothetical protein
MDQKGKKTMKTLITLGLMASLASTQAFASGFLCTSKDGLRVKLFNHVDPTSGTRTPAAMVISDETSGTLLVRKGEEIRKQNRSKTVRYAVDGNNSLNAVTVVVQIHFKEGREVLAEGESADGELILIAEDAGRNVFDLTCERYLKSR